MIGCAAEETTLTRRSGLAGKLSTPNDRGFTLVEVIVVSVIIAILAIGAILLYRADRTVDA